jgi:hypothetical protein
MLLDYRFVILLFGKRNTRFLQFIPCRDKHGMTEVPPVFHPSLCLKGNHHETRYPLLRPRPPVRRRCRCLRFGAAAGNVAVIESVVASNQSRDQVRAEAVVANRLGLIAAGEVQVQPTPAQLEQVRLAGRQAVQVGDIAQGAGDRVVR